jgi:hypothetical protein
MDFRPYVDRLFKEAPDRRNKMRRNPITGGGWVPGRDPVDQQKHIARRALVVRQWFASHGPGIPLPLTAEEREALKSRGGLDHVVSVYASSLAAQEYNIEHPYFDEYARGVMASPATPDFIRKDPQLLKRYPPRPLPGLGPGLVWRPATSP